MKSEKSLIQLSGCLNYSFEPKTGVQNVTSTTGYMAPNWDEPTGATSPQAILFSGNFTIWPLCHERQLHHLATLPTGVTSPCISVEPPCESCQNGLRRSCSCGFIPIGRHVTSCTGYVLHTSFWLKCWKLRCHDFSALAD